MDKKKIVLLLIDGYGLRYENLGNAINMAYKPNLDGCFSSFPTCEIELSGESIGLLSPSRSSSRLAHQAIGTGIKSFRVPLIVEKSIEDGSFYRNDELLLAVKNAQINGTGLHVLAMLSSTSNHLKFDHLLAFVKMAKLYGISRDQLYLHVVLDGRNENPKEAITLIKRLEDFLNEEEIGRIASVAGRRYVYTYDLTSLEVSSYFDALLNKEAQQFKDPISHVVKSYQELEEQGEVISDEYVDIAVSEEYFYPLKSGDTFLFLDYNPTQLKLIANKLETVEGLCLVSLSKIDKFINYAYQDKLVSGCLGNLLSTRNYRQFRVSESLRFKHITTYFDGQINSDKYKIYPNELTSEIISNELVSQALNPKMKASKIVDSIVRAMKEQIFDFGLVNFANIEVVGFSGDFYKTIEACEVVDQEFSRLYEACKQYGFTLMVCSTSSKGETMVDNALRPYLLNSSSNGIFCILDSSVKKIQNGRLYDIAPTILTYLGETIPPFMDGKSLI